MARFKSTENIFLNTGEVFNENMIDNPNLRFPQNTVWSENRPMKIEDIDIWEVIIEHGGPFGVYAAWQPYGELYIVVNKYSLIAEFSGINANIELEKYLQKEKIWYPKQESINDFILS